MQVANTNNPQTTNNKFLIPVKKKEFRYYDFMFFILEKLSKSENFKQDIRSFNYSVDKRSFDISNVDAEALINLFLHKSHYLIELDKNINKFKFVLLRAIIFFKQRNVNVIK